MHNICLRENIHLHIYFNFSGSDITRTCVLRVTVRPGGNGIGGKEISTGWPLTESILLSLLPLKRRSGKDYIENSISPKMRLTSIWADLPSYPGWVTIIFNLLHIFTEDGIPFLVTFRARMGNIRGFGGPLSSNWHNRTIRLQHRILRRMRELGIVPVLPAFAGHVPRAFARLFPNVNMTKIDPWNKFNDKYCWYGQSSVTLYCIFLFLTISILCKAIFLIILMKYNN